MTTADSTSRWPNELRGSSPAVPWLNRLLRASKASEIKEIKVTGGGVGKVDGNSAIISVNTGQPATKSLLPFSIYQVSNNTATDAQKKVFTDLGLSINDFTFQIASGLVGARTFINQPFGDQPLDLFFSFVPVGNFEQQLFCPCTDNSGTVFQFPLPPPAPNTGTCVILDNVNPTLIFGIPAGSPVNTPPTAYNQVVLNQINNGDPAIPSTANWIAAFWLEIIDDPLNGIYVNLMGQMLGENAPRTPQVFPSKSSVIPLGFALRAFEILTISGRLVTQTTQIQDGNLVNRWTPNSNTFRGTWTVLFAALPVGLSNLVFYPGDIAIDDTVTSGFASGSGVTSRNFYTVYRNIGTAPQFTLVANNPQGDFTNWVACGMAPAP